jgi:hypothetical protein
VADVRPLSPVARSGPRGRRDVQELLRDGDVRTYAHISNRALAMLSAPEDRIYLPRRAVHASPPDAKAAPQAGLADQAER